MWHSHDSFYNVSFTNSSYTLCWIMLWMKYAHTELFIVFCMLYTHTVIILYALASSACGTLTWNTSYTEVFNTDIGFLSAWSFIVLYCKLCEQNNCNNKSSPIVTHFHLYRSPSGYCRTYWEVFCCLLFLHDMWCGMCTQIQHLNDNHTITKNPILNTIIT